MTKKLSFELKSWKIIPPLGRAFSEYEINVDEIHVQTTGILWWKTIHKDVYAKIYRGDCTVWHEYPSGLRADTTRESLLCDIWQFIKSQEHDRKINELLTKEVIGS
jgi:hypothetical protein